MYFYVQQADINKASGRHEVILDNATMDIPNAGLCRGDLGAIVKVLDDEAFEVEFVAASGRTQALLTLRAVEGHALRAPRVSSVRTTGPMRMTHPE